MLETHNDSLDRHIDELLFSRSNLTRKIKQVRNSRLQLGLAEWKARLDEVDELIDDLVPENILNEI